LFNARVMAVPDRRSEPKTAPVCARLGNRIWWLGSSTTEEDQPCAAYLEGEYGANGLFAAFL
jgi:hypothetical protein